MERVKLTEICNPKQWKTIPTEDLVEDGYPVYGANGVIGYFNDYNHKDPVIAITCRGATCGTINITVPNSYVTGNAMCLDNVRSDISLRYLYYSLLHYDFKQVISGSAQPQITRQGLEKVKLFIGAKEEQETTVDILDRISRVLESRKQQLSALDDLIKARFVEMFGDPETNPKDWRKKPLSDVITVANNGMARRGNDVDGNIVMRLVELQDGYIDYSNPNRIVLTQAEKKKYLLNDKDFLFARVNGNPDNVGRCAVFYDIGEPVFHNDHIIRVHFNDNALDGPFASALLNSEYGKRQLRNQIKTSAGQYTVSQDGIGAIVAILPPLELQLQFAAYVAQIDKSKSVIQKSLDETQLLFDSLMQKYFG